MHPRSSLQKFFNRSAFWLILFLFLHALHLYNYLLYHSVSEIFSIIIASGIFMIAWNSRFLMDNNYLLFIGISYLFVALSDLIHTFAYSGMNIFPGYDANLATQWWLIGRYWQSLTLLTAPFFLFRKLHLRMVSVLFVIVFMLCVFTTFIWRIFPDAFVAETGLTLFKKVSEYTICGILIAACFIHTKYRHKLDEQILRLLFFSILFTIASELVFTLYTGVYDEFNMLGHVLKIISYYFIYRAIIARGLLTPYDLIFRNLKKTEEQLAEKIAELAHANAELEEFAHTASHDLQSPLNTIKNYLGILQKEYGQKQGSTADQLITRCMVNANQMKELVEDLLQFASLDKEEMKTFELYDLNSSIHESIEKLSNQIEESGAKVTYDKMPTLRCNETLMNQLFHNLIGNALKYRKKDQEPAVHIGCTENGIYWIISVRDNGIGINTQYQDKIFKKFQRLHPKSEYPGTGLGLSICKKIVDEHQGTIWVESEPGKGSSFFFKLPKSSES